MTRTRTERVVRRELKEALAAYKRLEEAHEKRLDELRRRIESAEAAFHKDTSRAWNRTVDLRRELKEVTP